MGHQLTKQDMKKIQGRDKASEAGRSEAGSGRGKRSESTRRPE